MSKRKKKEKFTEETSKKEIRIKKVHIGAVILFGVVIFALFGGTGAENVQDVSNEPTGTQSDNDPSNLYISISKINDGKAHFYKYPSATGKTIRFFVLKSSDGIFRAAFDACDVCYQEKKGYRQEGDVMVCNNCGRKFPSTRINVEQGGCNPAPLNRHMEDAGHNPVPLNSWTQNGYLVIKKSDIELGVRYF